MKFQPLVSQWLLIPYLVLALAAAGWQIWRYWRIYHQKHKGRTTLLRWIRRGVLLILPAIIALGISVPGGTSAPGIANLDVIFAIDTTPSMGALDYAGGQQRLDGVKNDLQALATKLQGARLEIITFDSNANIILPFTTDTSAFSSAVQGISPEVSNYSQGSAIDQPINLITQEMQNSKSVYPEHQRLVFYLGDGEQTANSQVRSFAPIASYINGGAVLGYGTTEGGKMVNYSSVLTGGTAQYISTVDANTKSLTPAISKIDPGNLQKIAAQLKVAYQNRNNGGTINSVYDASKAQLSIDRSRHIVHYLNLYWLFAIPYVVLLFWEWQKLIVDLLDMRIRRGGKHA